MLLIFVVLFVRCFFHLEELSSSDCVPNCPSDGYDIWLLMHFISDEELDIGFTSCYIDLCSRLVLGYFDSVIRVTI